MKLASCISRKIVRPEPAHSRRSLPGIFFVSLISALLLTPAFAQLDIDDVTQVRLKIKGEIVVIPTDMSMYLGQPDETGFWRTIPFPMQVLSNTPDWSLDLTVHPASPSRFWMEEREWTCRLLDPEGEVVCETRFDERITKLRGEDLPGNSEFHLVIEGRALERDPKEPIGIKVRITGSTKTE